VAVVICVCVCVLTEVSNMNGVHVDILVMFSMHSKQCN
jgi:hypothetical protein